MSSAVLSFRFVLIAILALTYGQHAFAAKVCYDKNGDQTNGLPCHPDSDEDGPCCNLGDICLSNGLCRPGPGVTNHGFVDAYVVDCTDQSWNSSSCFSGCNSLRGNGLKNCGNNEYCCYDMNGCDCESTSLFNLGAATFVTTLPLSIMPATSTPATAPATITTTPAAVSSTSPSPTTTGSTSSPTPTPTQTQAQTSKTSSAVIGAGIGVGVGVPLIAAIGLGFWFFRRRRNQQEKPPPYADSPYVGVQQMKGYGTQVGVYQPVPHNSEVYAHHQNQTPLPPQEMAATGTLEPQELDASVLQR